MNPGYLLMKQFCAYYWMSLHPNSDWEYVRSTMENARRLIVTPYLKHSDGPELKMLESHLITIDWMESVYKDVALDRDDLISRIRLGGAETQALADEFERMISVEVTEDTVHVKLKAIQSELGFQLNNLKIKTAIKKLHRDAVFDDNGLGFTSILNEFRETTDKLAESTNGAVRGLVGSMGSDEEGSLADIIERSREMNTAVGVIKTPFTGLNRACGFGGFRRGEFINFGALSHHYKTGIILDCFRGACQYNKPYLWDKRLKPLVLHISFENRLEQNIPTLIKSIWEAEYQKKFDPKKMSVKECETYLIDRLGRMGYTFRMEFYDSSDFDANDLVASLAAWRAKGYELHLVGCDYLELICGKDKTRRLDEEILHTLHTVRTFTVANGITFVNGHQLSGEAQDKFRDEQAGFVGTINNGGYYRNTKGLHHKLDLEFIQAKVVHDSGVYMEWARGKHRGGEETPQSHLIFAKKFREFGGLLDDVELDTPDIIPVLKTYLNNLESEGNLSGPSGGAQGGYGVMAQGQDGFEDF